MIGVLGHAIDWWASNLWVVMIKVINQAERDIGLQVRTETI